MRWLSLEPERIRQVAQTHLAQQQAQYDHTKHRVERRRIERESYSVVVISAVVVVVVAGVVGVVAVDIVIGAIDDEKKRSTTLFKSIQACIQLTRERNNDSGDG